MMFEKTAAAASVTSQRVVSTQEGDTRWRYRDGIRRIWASSAHGTGPAHSLASDAGSRSPSHTHTHTHTRAHAHTHTHDT
jgi:hypothetical protein